MVGKAETQSQRIRKLAAAPYNWGYEAIAFDQGCTVAHVRCVVERRSATRGRPRKSARVEDRCRRMVAKILGESRGVREAEEALEVAFERKLWQQKQYDD